MARRKQVESTTEVRDLPPASSMEEREDQIISASYNLALRHLLDGTASPLEINFGLRMGSRRERLTHTSLERKNELLTAQTDNIKSQEKNAELYARAIKAFGIYRGRGDGEIDDEELF